MRTIIDCEPSAYEAAFDVLTSQMPGWESRYNRVGWGWTQRHRDGVTFFVRRIKNGLSVTQLPEKKRA